MEGQERSKDEHVIHFWDANAKSVDLTMSITCDVPNNSSSSCTKRNAFSKELPLPMTEHADNSSIESTTMPTMARHNITSGLMPQEVHSQRALYGRNVVPEHKRHKLMTFLLKLNNMTAWMLEAVVVLTFALGEYANGAVVLALLLANTIMAFRHDIKGKSQQNKQINKKKKTCTHTHMYARTRTHKKRKEEKFVVDYILV